MDFFYDYGSWSPHITELWPGEPAYQEELIVVDGQSASLVTAISTEPYQGLSYVAGIWVPMVHELGTEMSFYGYADTETRRKTLVAIIKSVNFP